MSQFTVPAVELASAVKYAARQLDVKPVNPIHGGLLFEVAGDWLTVSGHGENATARAVATVGDVEGEPGAFLVAGRLIAALAETFPSGDVTIEVGEVAVAVSSGRFRATMPTMPRRDYPKLPEEAPLVGYINGGLLADAVSRVGSTASTDREGRQSLLGIHLSFGEHVGDPLVLIATDTYRASRQAVKWADEWEGPASGRTALVLASVLTDAIGAFGGAEDVAVGWGPGGFSLSTATRALMTRVHDEKDFPAVQLSPIFDMETSATAVLDTKTLAQPLKRSGLLRKDDNPKQIPQVTLRFSEDLVTVVTEGMNAADDEVDITYDGPETSMTVRTAPLLGGLSLAPGEAAEMHFNPGTTKPVIFTSPADPSWRYMLVPLRPTGGTR